MADYGKFSLSAPFAALLAGFEVEDHGQVSGENVPVLVCSTCLADVRQMYDEDMATLVQAVIDHEC